MLAVPPVRTLMVPVEVAVVPEVALARFWLAPPALTLSVAVLVSGSTDVKRADGEAGHSSEAVNGR